MANPVDYSSRDYASIREDLIAAIPSLLPEWTSRSPNDFGIILIELLAYVGDLLHYYIDRTANEAFIGTAVQRRSVLALAQMLDYRPHGASASVTTIQFSVATTAPTSITIPAKTKVSTKGTATQAAIVFETNEAITIAPGATGQVAVTQGESIEEGSTTPVGISNGQVDQEFTLYYTSVIEGSLKVLVDEDAAGPQSAQEWRFIEHLIDAETDERVYTTYTDENDVVHIVFGDGANGRVPVTGAVITATYRVGGGDIGNVGAGTVTEAVGALPYITAITNLTGASGGSDVESLAEIRRSAPRSLTALARAVTTDDYATLARQVSGVLHASATSSVYTSVTLYIAPNGGGAPSTALQNSVVNYLADKKMINTTISIASPSYVGINISLDPLAVLPRYSRSAVRSAVETALKNLLALENVDFGYRVTLSSVYRAIQSVEGVDYAVVTVLSTTGSGLADVVLAANEIPQAGTITFTTVTGGIVGS